MDETLGPDKFYVIVRADLPPGLQLAQSVHAGLQFMREYPELGFPWLANSNFLVCLSVPDEDSLLALCSEACMGRELKVTKVIEPDLGDEFTALAIQPGPEASALCATLPLALRMAYTF